jgi:hypothetical protein
LLVASLTRSLFRLVWQDLYFAFGSYNFATTFLATHIEDSRSGSLSCERSERSADEDLISLKTDCFPIPKIAEVVSQPVREFHRLCSTENYTSHELVYIAYHP